MNNNKKYWCFSCNSECQINIIQENDDEEYQCTKCKNSFIEEITKDDHPKNFHIDQSQINSLRDRNNLTNFNFRINSLNSFNLFNFSNNRNSRNQPQTEDEYGMNNILLFLPSTVNYVRRGHNRSNLNNIFNSSIEGIITEIVSPNNHNIFISRNLFTRNRPILGFLSNHRNDNQFENLLNIIMSFDSSHRGNPPASERAINSLKKIEINKENIKKFNEELCNVCLEDYVEGDITTKLECGHCFHYKCILQWLKMRNTCPVCRHELESNNPNYEKRKHSHRETLRNYQNNFENSNFGNNNNDGAESSA